MEQNHNQIVYWSHFSHEQWEIHLAATSGGLCYVGSPIQSFNDLERWVKIHLPDCLLLLDHGKLEPYTSQFKDYFQGRRTGFTLPFDFYGTPFQQSVWRELNKIAYGYTNCYSDIANRIQKPYAVRAVSTAISANHVIIAVPCHRVIGKDGTLTGYRGGLAMKANLLKLEKDYLTEKIINS